jgi:hypothetical protein
MALEVYPCCVPFTVTGRRDRYKFIIGILKLILSKVTCHFRSGRSNSLADPQQITVRAHRSDLHLSENL